MREEFELVQTLPNRRRALQRNKKARRALARRAFFLTVGIQTGAHDDFQGRKTAKLGKIAPTSIRRGGGERTGRGPPPSGGTVALKP